MAMQGLQALASMNQCKQQSVLPAMPPSSSPLGLSGLGNLNSNQMSMPSTTADAVVLQQQLACAIEQNQRMLSLLVESMKPAGQTPASVSSPVDARTNSSGHLPGLTPFGLKLDDLKNKEQNLLALAAGGLSRDPSIDDSVASPLAENVDSVPAALRLLQSMSTGAEVKKEEKKEASVNQSRYWTDEEHQRFLEGVRLFGANNHKAIAAVVRTRNSAQVRSHSQKFFKKLETFDGQGLPSMTRKRKNVKSQSGAQPLSFVTH
eukprot:CAMPEP_0184310322 /NCGR_PEP_ID=MMETSP1049-20130417/26811_1 /TAXON_ID=77928 /ORGANISM="Proteomonas sulcata, Strain CCMP704" /LENGTH=261 /DNA_ID=CAMNT_0026624237 /DNA_START=269 /DNA_END=1054 /DNA_ORIENTATION=-